MSDTTNATVARRRSGWDIVFGILMLIAGLVILGDTVVATTVSVFLIGWTAVVAGIVLAVWSFTRLRSDGFWWALLGGIVLAGLGVLVLQNPGRGALWITVFIGAVFVAGGVTRVVMAFSVQIGRWLFVIGGVLSVLLGGWILVNPVAATLTVLGVLLGVQVLVEGITLLTVGRPRITSGPRPPRMA
ncbi:HdeD family acid-resistance protein [Cellulomonas edaphi]|uniref:HdeD family acid-resistance protein n=1 Tax=Cellulomonas edaphi TaxID=3053468 RepID=A0ABT7S6T3_9CELL|nr:HdeD family acid-resistance protein [Cellulomons edaphi]MDM7831331.1 HdeD family acid-resistance protein [Cellulomons edaphi]